MLVRFFDSKLLREPSNRRKWIAFTKLSAYDGAGCGVNGLLIDGNSWSIREAERNHVCTITRSTP